MTPLRRRMIEDMQIRNLAPLTQSHTSNRSSGSPVISARSPERLGPTRDPGLADLPGAGQALGSQFDLRRGRRLAVPLHRHASTGLDRQGGHPHRPATAGASRRAEPGGSRRFLNAVKSLKHRVILTVCYAAGLRVSEAVQLKPSRDRQPAHGHPCGGGQRAERSLRDASPRLLDILRDYWKTRSPGEWLFPGDRPGQPITTVRSRTRLPRRPVSDPASSGRSRRIRCAMRSQSICWNPVPICAPSSCCLAIAASPPRHGICASPPTRSAPPPVHWMRCSDDAYRVGARARLTAVRVPQWAGSGGRVPPLRRGFP